MLQAGNITSNPANNDCTPPRQSLRITIQVENRNECWIDPMYALIAVGVTVAVFAILNLIDFKRLD